MPQGPHRRGCQGSRSAGPPCRRWITDLAAASRDRFAICLSGGSTPRRLYQLLAESPYRDALPWDRVHWFWGDERFVPWDHPDSNYGMAHDALLGRVPFPRRTSTASPRPARRQMPPPHMSGC